MILNTIHFILQYFVTMFVVTTPLAIIALFVSMTSPYTMKERMQTARLGCFVALGVVEFFALFGKKIFEFFGVSMGSFYIAGGILIFAVGFDMLRAQDSSEQITEEEVKDAKATAKKKGDIAITPLGIPIIAGPCFITNTIAQQAKASNGLEFIGGLFALVLVVGALYALLVLSARGTKWLTPTILKLSYRLSGLILAAIAVEMFVAGIKSRELGLLQQEATPVAQVEIVGTHSIEQGVAG
jgi:multiple antibiotic resistance protein